MLSARSTDSEAIISVRDTGIGIPPDMLTRIFDMFVQVDPRAEQNVTRQGLGIGLTLVKRLVELHGGTVEARSDGEGKGSEFIVRLPAFSDQRVTRAQSAQVPPTDGDRRKSDLPRFRILVVDDHHDSGDSLATLLRLMGHEVRVAYDGVTGTEAARAFRPQVAVLDIGMPGMTGIELGRRLRQEPGLDRLLMIALTGYGRDEDRERSREAGFDHHLVKPVDVAALNELLAQYATQLAAQSA